MARAKSTARAEARRRYRATQAETSRVAEGPEGSSEGTRAASAAVAGTGAPQARRGSFLGFRMPDVAGDLRALPDVIRGKPYVLAPFGLVILGAIVAALSLNSSIAQIFVYFTFYPSPALMYFAAGFIAPRGSYLFGGALGFLDAALLTALAGTVATSSATTAAPTPTAVASYIGTQVLLGAFFAGFSSWYRDFLRRSQQQRAQQSRANAKAKASQRPASKGAARGGAPGGTAKAPTGKGVPTGSAAAKPGAPQAK